MSNIDTKIEEHKRILADLEKQKKGEEEVFHNDMKERLNKLEEENRQLKTCQVSLDILKKRLDKLEEENEKLKTCQDRLDILENKFNNLKYIEDSEDWFDDIERKMDDIIGLDSIVHELDYRLDILESENEEITEKLYSLENKNVIENFLENNSIDLISF